MPVVLRTKGYRFFFFSNEGTEPPHIHVERAENYAKFWLDPVSLVYSRGFRSGEIAEIGGLIRAHREKLLEAWHEHFGKKTGATGSRRQRQ